MKKLVVIAISFFLGTNLYAQEKQSSQEGCVQLLQAYAQIQVRAEQASLVDGVQKGIVNICKRLMELEKPVPTPTQEPKKE